MGKSTFLQLTTDNPQPTTHNPQPFGFTTCYNGGNPTPGASTEGTSAQHWLRNAVVHQQPTTINYQLSTNN
ncbi:MAG: hypothetical protein KME31_10545 [Tolypothrix carrinoi HA7290-LM1]|nr:hypothetical protein [Tolypothrix carrinoi HA7290-LM1]